jgi:hypothetical protein
VHFQGAKFSSMDLFYLESNLAHGSPYHAPVFVCLVYLQSIAHDKRQRHQLLNYVSYGRHADKCGATFTPLHPPSKFSSARATVVAHSQYGELRQAGRQPTEFRYIRNKYSFRNTGRRACCHHLTLTRGPMNSCLLTHASMKPVPVPASIS